MQTVLKSTQNIGFRAEKMACDFLQSKGLQLKTRNYRCKMGEIDLIMQDAEEIVFVEVRLRTNADYGDAIESVDAKKQTKLIHSALDYLQKHRLLDKTNSRFDVIGFSNGHIHWIRDAFSYD